MAKSFFKTNGVTYNDFNVATDLDKRKEMIDKTGQMGVPVIDVNGKIIVGFNKPEIEKALRR